MMRSRSIKTVVVPLMLAAAVLAQGLRLCLHAPHVADSDHVHSVAVHLESSLVAPADSDGDANDNHLSFAFALVKKLADGSALAVAVTAFWLLSVPRSPGRLNARSDVAPPSGDRHRQPPLRAPPR
jgi:hypothetical protein